MKKLIFPIALFGFMAMFATGWAQTEEQQLLDQLLEDERNSVEALVIYPEDVRMAILEASKYPEALVKLEAMQSRTSDDFKSMMEYYPQATQQEIWDLTRYPGLVSKLVAINGEDPSGVLQAYPQEVHARARNAFYNQFYLLSEVDRLDREWRRAFDGLLMDYPPVTQDALRQLVELPEVLDILTENIRMTVLVGDLYKRKPGWLLEQLDSLNLVVARERAQELEDWKTSLEEDPQAREELVQSAESFADEYGYEDDYYAYDDDLYFYEDAPEETIIEHHYYYHYPYWTGYPYWYVYPRWRPYPWWWDWGFYYGPGRVIVFVDLPSFYFTHWYFYQPHHHYRYPHLSSHFVGHYYGHRHSSSSVVVSVNSWQRQNRNIVTENWLATARNQPELFREFGNFEEARTQYNRKHADQPLTQREFLDKNNKKYPELNREAVKQQEQERIERQAPLPPDQPRKSEPVVKPPKRNEPAPQKPKTEPSLPEQKRKTEPAVKPPPREVPAPQKPKTEPKAPSKEQQKVDIPKVDKARNYHKNTWEKSKVDRNQPPQTPRVTPPKSTRPKSTTTPKTRTSSPKVKKERGGGGQ